MMGQIIYRIEEPENVGVGRHFLRSSSLNPLPEQVQLEQVALEFLISHLVRFYRKCLLKTRIKLMQLSDRQKQKISHQTSIYHPH